MPHTRSTTALVSGFSNLPCWACGNAGPGRGRRHNLRALGHDCGKAAERKGREGGISERGWAAGGKVPPWPGAPARPGYTGISIPPGQPRWAGSARAQHVEHAQRVPSACSRAAALAASRCRRGTGTCRWPPACQSWAPRRLAVQGGQRGAAGENLRCHASPWLTTNLRTMYRARGILGSSCSCRRASGPASRKGRAQCLTLPSGPVTAGLQARKGSMPAHPPPPR